MTDGRKKRGAARSTGKAKGPPGAPRTRRGSPPPPRLTRPRLFTLLLAVLGLAAAAILTVRKPSEEGDSGTPPPLPAPRRTFTDSAISPSDFVGSERCAACHAKEFAAWKGSTHAAAGGVPPAAKVIASFNGPPIRFKDAEVIPSASGGRYTFTIRQAERADRVIRVDGVIGGGHMQGGGTQGFVTKMEDGTYRFAPFDFSRHGNTWFCNTIGRANHGWVPITRELPIGDCVDWPPVRVLGDEARFSNCMSCHGSQIVVALDSASHAYQTRFTSLGINCEACHGPGKRHIDLMRDPAAVASGAIGMRALATYTKDSSLGVCWQCHALKDRLRGGFVTGKPLEAYYSLRTPQLGDEAYRPDGRVRTFAYQQGHWYSDCYVNGGLTCTSCHDPHTQGYRDVTGNALPGRFDDRQCTSCHASKASTSNSTLHTRHAAGSEGSRCTSCHMPYLQEPELGSAIRYARSDHAIPIPRPAFDSSTGVVSACKNCHADKTESALDAQVTTWYGVIKPHPRAIDALVKARATSDRLEAARLVLVPNEQHTAVLFDGMAYFLDSHLDADMPSLEPDIVSRLEALARHSDLDVRALALASLHLARGGAPTVRAVLSRALDSAGNSEPLLRSRWSVILGYLADKRRLAGNGDAAIGVYRKALEVDPTNPQLYLNLGLAYAQIGDGAAAITQYTRSLELDHRQPLTLVNLGIALEQQARPADAVATYRQALALNPRDPLANFNLANVYLKVADLSNAATYYERAVAADPSIAVAHVYLARIRAQQGDARSALNQLDMALEFDPANQEALAMRVQLGRSPPTTRNRD